MPKQNITRKCSTCKSIKLLSEFYKDKSSKLGHKYECKPCCYKRLAEYRTTEQGKIVCDQVNSKYYKTIKGKESKNRCSQAYRLRYPQRVKASAIVNRRIINGKIPRADTLNCIYCGNDAKEYHHDQGYSRKHWLDVVPVCVPCHNNLHYT